MTNKLLHSTTKDYLNLYAPYCTHAITLQTKLSTLNVSAKQMDNLLERASRTARQFTRRIAVVAYGNGAIRKPHLYHPLIITAIEGTTNTYDNNRTLHLHIALGNILTPTSRIQTEQQLETAIRKEWLATADGVDDIDIQQMTSDRWITYITKEFEVGNAECIDWQNCYIPKAALQL
jgi:hypothetical protein